MPFDFYDFIDWCADEDTTDAALQEAYQRYVRHTATGSTGTAVTVGLAFLTGGLSLFATPYQAARMANASTKIQIIKDEIAKRNRRDKARRELEVRPQDVFGGIGLGTVPMFTSGVEHVVLNGICNAPNLYHGTPYHGAIEYK